MRSPRPLAVAILLLQSAASHAAPAAASLCTSGETVVFSCRAGAKMLSVCARRAASGELLYAQYRFGRGRPEIAIPATIPFDLSAFRGETRTGTGGSTTLLSVRNGDVVYEIAAVSYFRNEPGHGDEASVSATRGDQQLAQFDCRPQGPVGGLFDFIRANHVQPPEAADAP